MYTPDQWAEEIIKSRRSKPFKVTKMDSSKFVSLALPGQKKHINRADDGETFRFTEVRVFHLSKQFPGKMRVYYSFANDEYQTIDVRSAKSVHTRASTSATIKQHTGL